MNASWLSAGISANTALAAAFAAAALAVILAVLLCYRVARRRAAKRSVRRGSRRISVRDIVKLDERRRLVLIRRDNIEHLLLTGGDSDLVVESFPESGAARGAEAFKERGLFVGHESAQGAAPRRAQAVNHPEQAGNNYTAKPQALPGSFAEQPPAPRRAPVPSYTPAARQAQQAEEQNRAAASARQNAASGAQPYPEAAAKAERLRAEEQQMRGKAAAEQREPQTENSAARPEQTARMPAEPPLYAESEFAPSQEGRREVAGQNGDAQRFAAPKQEQNQRQNGEFSPPRPAANEGSSAAQADADRRGAPDFADFNSGREREAQMRPAPGVYAPYLGYMPNAAASRRQSARPQQPAPARNMRQAEAERGQNTAAGRQAHNNYGSDSPFGAAAQERGGNAASAPLRPAPPPRNAANPADAGARGQQWSEAENRNERGEALAASSAAALNNASRSAAPQPRETRPQNGFYSYERGRNAPEAKTRPESAAGRAPFNPFQEAQQDSGAETRRVLNTQSGGALRNGGGNGFAPINPADDNDFDKILQDELLRAPNTIRFPVPQKK